MDLLELFRQSVKALLLNKLRTGLAMLGIVIGIGSVITLVSLGEASQQSIQSSIQSLGSNLLSVSPGSQRQAGVRSAAGSSQTLTNADAAAIQSSSQIHTVGAVSPEIDQRAQVTIGNNNSNIRINGAVPAFAEVHKITMDSGVFISDADVIGGRRVMVIGPQVASDLFPSGESPLGKTVRIKNSAFQVIGVTVSKGGTGFLNQDNVAYIPLSTAQKQVFGQSYLSDISLEAKIPDVMTQAQNDVGYLLLARHKISDPTKADFSILSQADILSTASSTTGTFTALLAGIAGISLLVGGIGIMNIMLMSVTERTREIGLRKALGAKRRTIVTQFLFESIILTFAGGIIGIFVGVIASFLYARATSSLFVVSPSSIFIAFVVSAVIGIVFGWYPASRAAHLQPIEALRYE